MSNLILFNQEVNKEIELIGNIDASHQTIADYKARLPHFLQFAGTTYTEDILLAYKRNLENNLSLSVSTKNKYLAVAKAFLKECNKKGICEIDVDNVKSFKEVKGHKKTGHNEEEVKDILNRLKLADERTKIIMFLAIFQGLRQIEIVRINIEDINLKEGTILIQGKGQDGKELVYLHPIMVTALDKFLKGKKSGRLINLSTRQVRNIYYKIAGTCDKSMHGLRHYFTTKLIDLLDGNLIEVSKYTRHKSLEMLTVYNDEVTTKKTLPKVQEGFNKLFTA